MRTVQLSESVYIRMAYGAGSPGVCLSLYGLEEALIMGRLDITNDSGGADE